MKDLAVLTVPHPSERTPMPDTPEIAPRVYIETYGCQMNVSDSELMHGILCDAGYSIVEDPAQAAVIVVNTCSVRERAEERVFGRLGELTQYKNRNPAVILCVTGCMAERLGESIAKRAKAVDIVAGPDSYRTLPELIGSHLSDGVRAGLSLDVRFDRSENYIGLDPVTRESATAWVTIMRGCDRFCTFCIVPYTRGREKCVPPDEVVRQVQSLAECGCREVNLLGQTVNSYRYGDTGFADLLRIVSAVDGIERVRFTSPHPVGFDVRTIAAMAETPEVCPYVHLPVQSGDDSILEQMRRDYTADQYLRLVDDLRSAIPGIALSTDVIVGFPGETEEQFQRTLDLVAEVKFDFAFMFKYSSREGTIAARRFTDDVTEEEKGRRLSRLIGLQESISAEVFAAKIGETVEVLVEGPAKKQPEYSFGRAPDFKSVVFSGRRKHGTFVNTLIVDATAHTLKGRIV